MKTVAVFYISRAVGETFVTQIRRFFTDSISVVGYCLQDDLDFEPSEVLALLTGVHVERDRRIQEKIALGMDFLVARRVIDYTRIRDLLALPEGTEVLLVNDFESTARDSINHLLRIGLDHLVYHPYYPGVEACPRLTIAVTPGESALVPAFVEQTIDIGIRHVDISTIVELIQRLDMMDQLGDFISSRHIREITRLLREIDEAGKRVSTMRDTLQIVADHAPNAILYTDLAGRVILGNQAMSQVLGMSPEAMVNQPATDLVPSLASMVEAQEANHILSIGGQELVVQAKSVRQKGSLIGRIYTFESSHTIKTFEYELRRRARKTEHEARYTFSDIISASPQMDRLRGYARRLAQSDSTILIQGETGTGKELFAQAIHNASARRQGPFVPVNFAAFPMSLLESELFGYEEGAFTGARKGGRRGLFEEAHGGTIFLDEIGDAPLAFQVSLLRVLQERQVRPVGGQKLIPIDVRVIAATNKNLGTEMKQGSFREDLYYRLSVLPLKMPSLCQRREDIPMLIEHFIRRFSHGRVLKADAIMSPDTLVQLLDYPWPGNIRQLMNAVEFLMNIREDFQLLQVEHLPDFLQDRKPGLKSGLIQDVLGQDLVWVLGQLGSHGSLGRRQLAERAGQERPHLTEGKIRGLLITAETLGLTLPGSGNRGPAITERGRLAAGLVAG